MVAVRVGFESRSDSRIRRLTLLGTCVRVSLKRGFSPTLTATALERSADGWFVEASRMDGGGEGGIRIAERFEDSKADTSRDTRPRVPKAWVLTHPHRYRSREKRGRVVRRGFENGWWR